MIRVQARNQNYTCPVWSADLAYRVASVHLGILRASEIIRHSRPFNGNCDAVMQASQCSHAFSWKNEREPCVSSKNHTPPGNRPNSGQGLSSLVKNTSSLISAYQPTFHASLSRASLKTKTPQILATLMYIFERRYVSTVHRREMQTHNS